MTVENVAVTEPVKQPRVQRNVAWLIVNGLITSLGGFLITGTILQAFLLKSGLSDFQLGMLGSVSAITAALAMFSFLGIADSLRRRLLGTALTRLTIVIVPLGLVLLALRQPPVPVILATVLVLISLQNMVESVHGMLFNSLFIRCLPARLRGRFTGTSGIVTQLGVIGLGITAAAWLAWQPFPWNYTICFAVAILCMLLSVITILCLREVPSLQFPETARAQSPLAAAWQVIHLREFRALLAPNLLRGITGGTGYFVFAMGWERLHLSPQHGALLATLTAGGGLVGMAAIGLLHDRYGAGTVCLIGDWCMAAGLLGTVFSGSPLWFLAFGAVHAIGGTMEGSGVPLGTYDVSPPERIAAYNGVRLLLLNGSGALSMLGIGYLLDYLDSPVPVFVAGACVAALNGFLYWGGFRRARQIRHHTESAVYRSM